MLELPEELALRTFRVEVRYTATRLKALPETRGLAAEFDEAHDRLVRLEDEEGQLAGRSIEVQAAVEIADDGWDDAMLGFQRRLLDLVEQDVDAPLYREYFADIPSHVTSLSYGAEVMISKELEARLAADERSELREVGERLAARRATLESSMLERTRLEVDEARFLNRSMMAKAITNKLRRVLFARLEELARARGLPRAWCLRFFHTENLHLGIEAEGAQMPVALGDGLKPELPEATIEETVSIFREPT